MAFISVPQRAVCVRIRLSDVTPMVPPLLHRLLVITVYLMKASTGTRPPKIEKNV